MGIVLTGCVGVFVLLAAYVVVASIVRGWVLTYLWQWFILPVFDVRDITIVEAIGLSMVVTFLTVQQQQTKDERDGTEKASDLVAAIIYPFLVLVIAWIVHQFQ